MKRGTAGATIMAVVVAMGAFVACAKSDSEKKKEEEEVVATPTATPAPEGIQATDMSALALDGEISAIFPNGTLSLNLTTYDSPCSGELGDTTGDPAGPDRSTIQCRMAKLFADPDTYTQVGQEGFLESISIFTKVFRLSLKNCASPFAADARNVTIPVIGEVVEFACGKTPAASELAANFKIGAPNMFGDAPASQIEQVFSNAVISLLWGEGSHKKSILAGMNMPPKNGEASGERAAWWYSKGIADGKISLQSAMFKADAQNRRFLMGSPETHEFEFNYLWQTKQENEPTKFVAFRGAGYSEGAGKFYLVQAKSDDAMNGGVAMDGTQVLSFCFDADTKAEVDASQCSAFVAKVEAREFFTAADLPKAESEIPVTKY